MAQSVERILGKDEVTGSIPVISSKNLRTSRSKVFLFGLKSTALHDYAAKVDGLSEYAALHARILWWQSK